jgi:hypothetical protein
LTTSLAPLISRLITILAGVACLVVGHLMPDLHLILYPAGAGLIGWATPHVADAINKDGGTSNGPNTT